MRIFISHSTEKTNAAGKQRLLDLKQALEAGAAGHRGHEVLLDLERLKPGFQWRSVLDEWMACCHSAVLMLDPVAIKSWWVLKEATILAHRAARDKDFLLFPALLGGVKRDELARSDSPFSKLYLDALQRLSKTDAAGIAKQVCEQLAKLAAAPITPMDALATRIATQIRHGDTAQLEAVCEKITGKPVQWSPQDSRAERCAHEIAGAIVRGERGNYVSLRDLIRALRVAGVSGEALDTTLKCAAPLWVPGRAAAPLADLAQRNLGDVAAAGAAPQCWAAALNGVHSKFTSDMYMRRAYLPDRETIRTLVGGNSDHPLLDELIAKIRDELRNEEEGMQGALDDEVDSFLKERTMPYFIVLPRPVPDEPLLRQLQTHYPRVTFILHTGRQMTEGALLPPRVVPLDPAVDIKVESGAFQDWAGTRDDIKNG